MYFAGISPPFIHMAVDSAPVEAPGAGSDPVERLEPDTLTRTMRHDGDPHDLLLDDRLTAMGLFVETSTALIATFESALAAAGVPGSSFEVLVRLARSPDRRLRMAELAAQCTVTSSGLTRLVDRLVRDGLVTREPCESDRRGWYAVLTDAGLAEVVRVLPDHLALVEQLYTGVLDPEELRAFLRTLRRLRAVVRPGADPDVASRLADDA